VKKDGEAAFLIGIYPVQLNVWIFNEKYTSFFIKIMILNRV